MGEWRSVLVGILSGLTFLAIAFAIMNRMKDGEEPPLPTRKPNVTTPASDPLDNTNPASVNPDTHSTRVESTAPPIVDSAMSRDQALSNQRFPSDIVDAMELVDVEYLGFDGKLHRGQLMIHAELAQEIKAIFRELVLADYPVEKVIPISSYQWDDEKSIADNNTSAFNYRKTITPSGEQEALSQHAYGRAVDVNPYLNPYVNASGKSPRPYDPGVRGTLTADSPAVRIFLKYGWEWGGHWKGGKDYQHFVKKAASGKLN